jgi:hypothetical protein
MKVLLIVLGVYVIGWGLAFLYVRRVSLHGADGRFHQLLFAAAWWPIVVPLKLGSAFLDWRRKRVAEKSV